MNDKIEAFFSRPSKWNAEYRNLRRVVLGCGLVEEYKWMHPCYTFKKRNVVLIHGFKTYCALLFYKGALLNDANGILVQQTENVQAARQIRFTDVQQVIEMEAILKAYIYEAIEIEKAGLRVELKKTSEFPMPEEFQKALDGNPELKAAFNALTPGRQRGYLLHFSQAKQSKTRVSRIEKNIRHILIGKGLND